jgi:hypothetical protein
MVRTGSVALIQQFIEAAVRADPDEFAGYFTEDAIWWNAPWNPVKGAGFDSLDAAPRGAKDESPLKSFWASLCALHRTDRNLLKIRVKCSRGEESKCSFKPERRACGRGRTRS